MEKNNCISKCFQPKTKVLHPLYLKLITSNKPFCLVNNNNYYEECDKSQITSNIDYFVPSMNMNEKLILKNIYEINSWEDVYKYQNKNKKDHKFTIRRILQFSWISFYNETKNDIDIIIKCYNLFFNQFHLKLKIDIEILSKFFYSISKNIKKYDPETIHKYIEKKNIY